MEVIKIVLQFKDMTNFIKKVSLISSLWILVLLNNTYAGDVEIIAAKFQQTKTGIWSVNVTLKHDDAGWDHYADNWQIVDGEGKILGDRVLYHPHVDEQPFTRSLSHVNIPSHVEVVYVTAHDKVHGWTPNRLKVDLGHAKNNYLNVEKNNP
jgi:hypothetical protein